MTQTTRQPSANQFNVSPKFLWGCLLLVVGMVGTSAYQMASPTDWLLENFLVLLFVAGLGWQWREFNLSRASYILILVFLAFHELGAHYTYSEVPLGEWIKPLFHADRNHYDRVIHFSFGVLLSWPMCEAFANTTKLPPRWWPAFLTVLAHMACSAAYELIEFGAAQVVAPELGDQYLGQQGDVWDAQKDMGLATLGALIPLVLWVFRKKPTAA